MNLWAAWHSNSPSSQTLRYGIHTWHTHLAQDILLAATTLTTCIWKFRCKKDEAKVNFKIIITYPKIIYLLILKPYMIGELGRAISLVRPQFKHGVQEGVQLIYLSVVHCLRVNPFEGIMQRRTFLNIDDEFTWRDIHNVSSEQKYLGLAFILPSSKNSSLYFPPSIRSTGKSPKITIMIATCEGRPMSVGNNDFPANIS